MRQGPDYRTESNFVPIVIVISGVAALGERLDGIQMLAIGMLMLGVIVSNADAFVVRKLQTARKFT